MRDVLLLHGAIGAKDQWEPMAKILADDFRLHLLNFPGHGGEETNAAFSIPFFANAVLDWMQRNGTGK